MRRMAIFKITLNKIFKVFDPLFSDPAIESSKTKGSTQPPYVKMAHLIEYSNRYEFTDHMVSMSLYLEHTLRQMQLHLANDSVLVTHLGYLRGVSTESLVKIS